MWCCSAVTAGNDRTVDAREAGAAAGIHIGVGACRVPALSRVLQGVAQYRDLPEGRTSDTVVR